MATLTLICGLPGAGKTTLARRLVDRAALRLTPDEWMARLNIDLSDEPGRAAVEALQWEVGAQALALGVNVILDWGFWSRTERDEYCRRAAQLGVRAQIEFLNVPRQQLWERLEARNASLPPATARLSLHQLEEYVRMFEPPTADELTPSNEGL